MRILVVLAALLAGFVGGLLLGGTGRIFPENGESAPHHPVGSSPDLPSQSATTGSHAPRRGNQGAGTDALLEQVRASPHTPRTQKDLAVLVYLWTRRGAAAVPEIVRLLKEGKDVALEPLWRFQQGQVVGYPTLRAACLEALRRIPGPESTQALQDAFFGTQSPEESYVIAAALEERGTGGFVADLLARARRAGAPVQRQVRSQMVELAARADPGAAEQALLIGAPRGSDPGDPSGMAELLRALPWSYAQDGAAKLLGDPAVTPKAKARYFVSLLQRPEVEAFSEVRRILEDQSLQDDLRNEAANAAATSPAFVQDAVEYQVATAQGDAAKAAQAKDRFEARMKQARGIVEAAFHVDANRTRDKRALAVLRTLENQQRRLETH